MLTYLPTVLYSGALAFNQIFQLDELFGITSFQSIAICVLQSALSVPSTQSSAA